MPKDFDPAKWDDDPANASKDFDPAKWDDDDPANTSKDFDPAKWGDDDPDTKQDQGPNQSGVGDGAEYPNIPVATDPTGTVAGSEGNIVSDNDFGPLPVSSDPSPEAEFDGLGLIEFDPTSGPLKGYDGFDADLGPDVMIRAQAGVPSGYGRGPFGKHLVFTRSRVSEDDPGPMPGWMPDDVVPGSKWVVGPDNMWLLLPPDLQDGRSERHGGHHEPGAGDPSDDPEPAPHFDRRTVQSDLSYNQEPGVPDGYHRGGFLGNRRVFSYGRVSEDDPGPMPEWMPDDVVPGSKWVVRPDNIWLLLPPDLQDSGAGTSIHRHAGGDDVLQQGEGRVKGRSRKVPVKLAVPLAIVVLLVIVVGAVILFGGDDGDDGDGDDPSVAETPVESVQPDSELVVDAPVVEETDSVEDDPPPEPNPVEVVTAVSSTDTYQLQMSDGRQFAIYRFELGGVAQLAILLPQPGDCWIIQYAPSDAEVVGTCPIGAIDVTPEQATPLLAGADRTAFALRADAQLAVGDGLVSVQGVESNLAEQEFLTVPIDDNVIIDGELFTPA